MRRRSCSMADSASGSTASRFACPASCGSASSGSDSCISSVSCSEPRDCACCPASSWALAPGSASSASPVGAGRPDSAVASPGPGSSGDISGTTVASGVEAASGASSFEQAEAKSRTRATTARNRCHFFLCFSIVMCFSERSWAFRPGAAGGPADDRPAKASGRNARQHGENPVDAPGHHLGP